MQEDPDIGARITALQRRVEALEARQRGGGDPVVGAADSTAEIFDDDPADAERFWALRGLQRRITDPGGVLLTGSVRLPGGERYVWQQGALAKELLQDDWHEFASALDALGHPMRLTLLQQVLDGRATTAELADHDDVGTTGQLHHHLRQLVAAGWLRSRTRGRYHVPAERVIPLLVILEAVRR
ncbi:MAG: ArsR/SmtB family transcription factor [Egibacteraceae bacterium]